MLDCVLILTRKETIIDLSKKCVCSDERRREKEGVDIAYATTSMVENRAWIAKFAHRSGDRFHIRVSASRDGRTVLYSSRWLVKYISSSGDMLTLRIPHILISSNLNKKLLPTIIGHFFGLQVGLGHNSKKSDSFKFKVFFFLLLRRPRSITMGKGLKMYGRTLLRTLAQRHHPLERLSNRRTHRIINWTQKPSSFQ